METFRSKWCYATITVTVCLAMICRLIYQQLNEEEFTKYPDKKRLDIKFSFTQIQLINKWMLFWALSVIVFI